MRSRRAVHVRHIAQQFSSLQEWVLHKPETVQEHEHESQVIKCSVTTRCCNRWIKLTTGRIRWVSGRPGEAPAYAGTDLIIARDGRIAAVYLFFDELP